MTAPRAADGPDVRVLRIDSLEIAYDATVLAPRPWTAWQAHWAADLSATVPSGRILELCAGAGQIGLLAALGSGRDLVAVDRDERACAFARANAQVAGIDARVEVRCSDLATACAPDERYPLILADPPWVPAAETGRFPEDPLGAIDGGADGLSVARACVRVIDAHLAVGGAALLQLGTTAQADALAAELPGSLGVVEVRTEPERGVVVHLQRPD